MNLSSSRTIPLALLFATVVSAQLSDMKLPVLAEGVGFDQRLGAKLDLGLHFTDEHGVDTKLSSLFSNGPVILAPVYYQCPMLCNLVLNGLFKSIKQLPQVERSNLIVIAISFDPEDTPEIALRKKAAYLTALNESISAGNIHFLIGSPDPIRKAMTSIGFRYRWDPDHLQFAHASGIVILTNEGMISRYFFGIDYPANALNSSLVTAAEGRSGSLIDKVLLFCLHYDGTSGKYTPRVSNLLRIFSAIFSLILLSWIVRSVRVTKAGCSRAERQSSPLQSGQ